MKRVISSILFILIAGCSVGPDYVRPELAMPEAWNNSPRSDAAKAELVEWWTQFQDPKLASLVDRALEANLDLKKAAARIRQARAQATIARADWYPSVAATGQYRRSKAASNNRTVTVDEGAGGTTIDRDNSAEDFFEAGFDASWELDVFGGTRRAVESAEAGVQAAIEDERDVRVTLLAEVATHYAQFRGFQERLQVARSNLEIQRQSAEISRKRHEAGFASVLDLAQAESEAATTEAQIPQLEASVRTESYALSVLLGEAPGSLENDLNDRVEVPRVAAVLPLGFPSELLSRRPDVRRSEALLHAASADVGVATAQLYPNFSLSGFLGVQGDNFSSLGFWDNHLWNLGSSIFWPIFEGGRLRAGVEGRSAALDEARADYELTVLNALSEVESSLAAYDAEQRRQKSLRIAFEQNRKALDAARKLYAEGIVEFLNVVSAERSLFASEDALTVSSVSSALNLISLYKALGGGWSEDVPTA